MKIRFVLSATAMLLATAILTARADDKTPPPPPDGSAALAEECSTFAHQVLHGTQVSPTLLKMSAALYRAAARLNPNEPRFARALVDNLLQLGDADEASKALTAYRALVPDDQTAQVRQIDLYLRSPAMQSNDDRLKYLRKILYTKQIPAEVRSEASVRCARVLYDRADYAGALKMLDTAVTLNPLNITALRMRLMATEQSASPVDLVTQMAAIFEANPTDPVVAARIAEQLAQLGVVDRSVEWYVLANRIYQATEYRTDPAFLLGAASELLISGRAEDASAPAGSYISAANDDPDGWYLGLSIGKYQSGQDPKDHKLVDANSNVLRKATIALTNRLQNVRVAIGEKEAATRPLDAPSASVLPVLTDDLGLLAKSNDPRARGDYIGAVSSLAWLDLFYGRDADAAQPLLDVLAKLLPMNDPALGRLQGWQLYIRGDAPGASAKFKPLLNTDPLAALGQTLIDLSAPTTQPSGQAKAEVAAQRLLEEHPSGVLGAVLWVELNPYKATVEPSPLAKAASQVIDNMPQSVVDILQSPQSFYLASVEPTQASYDFGEPLIVRVSLENVGSVPLAIGDLSAIKPEVWFDGFLRGLMEEAITGAAIARLDQRIVLLPGRKVSMNVRVDQDALQPILNQYPGINLGLNLTMIMNPIQLKPSSPDQLPEARAGMCGYSTQLSNIVERTPTPIETGDQRTALMARLDSGDGDERFRVIKVIALYAAQLHGDPKFEAISEDFIAHIRKVRSNSASINAWQQYILEQLDDPDSQVTDLSTMAKDPNWQTRLMALIGASVLDSGKSSDMADQLAADTDPIISGFAQALQQAAKISTTQPAANIGMMPGSPKNPASDGTTPIPDSTGNSNGTTPAPEVPNVPGAPDTPAPASPDAPAMPAQ